MGRTPSRGVILRAANPNLHQGAQWARNDPVHIQHNKSTLNNKYPVFISHKKKRRNLWDILIHSYCLSSLSTIVKNNFLVYNWLINNSEINLKYIKNMNWWFFLFYFFFLFYHNNFRCFEDISEKKKWSKINHLFHAQLQYLTINIS